MAPARLALLARLALAAVWLSEGLVLKLVLHDAVELDVVARSGLYWFSPLTTLLMVGALETGAGLVLLLGYRPRLAAVATTAALVLITAGVVGTAPELLLAPLSGIVKNGALVVCAAVVWTLTPAAPCPALPEVSSTPSTRT
ncbi:MAG TPA: DoxX-like family protein, partial [Rubricoccaceae bacterium]